MEDKIISNRINEALALKGMKQVELCEKTGINKASINAWIKQNWQPKQRSLYKMARALNVSELWLAGYDVPMEVSEKQRNIDQINDILERVETDAQIRRILAYAIRLNAIQLDSIENILSSLAEEK